MPFGKAAHPFQHSPLLLVPTLDVDSDLDWDFATSTDIAAMNAPPRSSQPVPGPSAPARSTTPERQTLRAQEPATPGNSSSPVVDNTPYSKSVGSNTVTAELSAGTGAQFQPRQAAQEADIIRQDIGVVHDLEDSHFLRLVFNHETTVPLLDAWLDLTELQPDLGYMKKLNAYDQAWEPPKDPDSSSSARRGREVDTYVPFIELCNYIANYWRRHNLALPSFHDPALFELVDIHDNSPRDSISERKPDISGRDRDLHRRAKFPKESFWSFQLCVKEIKPKWETLKPVLGCDVTTLPQSNRKRSAPSHGQPESKKARSEDFTSPDTDSHSAGSSDDVHWFTYRPQKLVDVPVPHEGHDVGTNYGDHTPFINIHPRARPGKSDEPLNAFEAQLMGYATEMFDNGVLRNHVISFLVTRDEVIIIYTDRSIALRSTFSLKMLPLVIYAMLKMDRVAWGYMSSMSKNPVNAEKVAKSTETAQMHPKRFQNCDFFSPDTQKPLFSMERVLFSARTVKGRGTKVFTVKPRKGLGDVLPGIEHWVESQRKLAGRWSERVERARVERDQRLNGEVNAQPSAPDTKGEGRGPAQPSHLMSLEALALQRRQSRGLLPVPPDPVQSSSKNPSKKKPSDNPPIDTPSMTLRSHTKSSKADAESDTQASSKADTEGDTQDPKPNLRPHDSYVTNTLGLRDFSVTERVGCVVAKISSIPRGREKEFNIVRDLRSIASKEGLSRGDHLPLFFDHRTIKFDSSTPQARIHLWAQQANIPYEMRHVEVLVQDLRYPVTQIYDVYEMAAAYRDIFEVLVWLKDQKVHHRDISLANCQFRLVSPHDKHNNRRTVGVLSDFDLAVKYTAAGHSPTANFRTGTLPFMAVEMLDPPNPGHFPHFPRHDMECLYYVIVYHLRTFHKDGGLNFKQPLAPWFHPDRQTVAAGKIKLLSHGFILPQDEFLPGYRHLFSALEAIRLHIHAAVMRVVLNEPIQDLETVDGRFNIAEVRRLFGNLVEAAANA